VENLNRRCTVAPKEDQFFFAEEYWVHFVEIAKGEEIDDQDLVERICEIPPVVRSGKAARRLRLRSEFNL
jgi:hypothetical protein